MATLAFHGFGVVCAGASIVNFSLVWIGKLCSIIALSLALLATLIVGTGFRELAQPCSPGVIEVILFLVNTCLPVMLWIKKPEFA